MQKLVRMLQHVRSLPTVAQQHRSQRLLPFLRSRIQVSPTEQKAKKYSVLRRRQAATATEAATATARHSVSALLLCLCFNLQNVLLPTVLCTQQRAALLLLRCSMFFPPQRARATTATATAAVEFQFPVFSFSFCFLSSNST